MMRTRSTAVIALLAAALTGLGTASASAAPAAAPATGHQRGDSLVVHTDKGAVRGVRAGPVENFLGIRYAAAPVGGLRWHPPQPAPRWSGVLPADHYGNRCPALASTNGPRSETEDCLFLNVQRPAGTHRGDHLPVYFWIHGGGLLNGSSNQHDGSTIVTETGVVVVTINYRLGVFGFLGHPALTAEAGESGNYGFDDQQAALRWVRRNIAAFGGDLRQVTIGGESAGGWSVCAHLSAPGSRGLFIRDLRRRLRRRAQVQLLGHPATPHLNLHQPTAPGQGRTPPPRHSLAGDRLSAAGPEMSRRRVSRGLDPGGHRTSGQ